MSKLLVSALLVLGKVLFWHLLVSLLLKCSLSMPYLSALCFHFCAWMNYFHLYSICGVLQMDEGMTFSLFCFVFLQRTHMIFS